MAKSPKRRRILRAAVFVVALGVLPAAISAARAMWASAERIYEPAEVPKQDVGMVLGARVDDDASPSPFLAARLDVAVDLYRRGKVRALLVSGNGYAESNYETRAMRDYLMRRGVPEERIVEDVGGFDTYDSCVRARDTFGVEKLTVVTQDYHLPRAVAICRDVGIDAVGVADTTVAQRHRLTWWKNLAREIPANLKKEWDVLTRRPPRQVDPRSDELDRAVGK